MRLQDLVFDAKKTLGDKLVLLGIRKVNVYVEGKRTDEVKGFKYEILTESHERIEVLIRGNNPLVQFNNEFVEVEFEGLQVKVYIFDQGYRICFYADDIRLKQNK